MAGTWTEFLDAIRRRLAELGDALEDALVPQPEPIPVPVGDGRRRPRPVRHK